MMTNVEEHLSIHSVIEPVPVPGTEHRQSVGQKSTSLPSPFLAGCIVVIYLLGGLLFH